MIMRSSIFFDSGATSSLIALRLVKQFQVEILPSSVQIKSANNEVNPVVGVTPLMTINMHNHLRFAVIGHGFA